HPAPVRAGAARALWSDADAGVRLHADEVVAARQVKEPVVDLRFDLEARVSWLRAVLVLKVGDGERDSDRRLRVRLDRGCCEAVGVEEVVSGAPRGALVARDAPRGGPG